MVDRVYFITFPLVTEDVHQIKVSDGSAYLEVTANNSQLRFFALQCSEILRTKLFTRKDNF